MFSAEAQRQPNKRRKRKGSQSSAATNNTPAAPTKKRSPGPNFSLASQVRLILNEIEGRTSTQNKGELRPTILPRNNERKKTCFRNEAFEKT